MLGWVTLLVFPIPTFAVLYWLEGIKPIEILELNQLTLSNLTLGISFGVSYALLALLIMRARIFQEMPSRIETMVQQMNLSIGDSLFLSLCAGIGEEFLFRSGMQFYLGPVFTSLFFVAIHGYLNPKNWKYSLYGLLVLPFILGISYALEPLGIWFCIAAHFAYDLVLFLTMRKGSPLLLRSNNL